VQGAAEDSTPSGDHACGFVYPSFTAVPEALTISMLPSLPITS
jgi:hypothetical protein